MRTMRWVVVWSLFGLLGCSATMWYGNLLHPHSTTLSLGMSKAQVQTRLGAPQSVVTQQMQYMLIETWKYVDRTLTFHNGMLQSWAADAPANDPAPGAGKP